MAPVTQSQIVGKLDVLLHNSITTEAEAVYLMVGIRKLIEHLNVKDQYNYLKFHCDWALHSRLKGTMAQEILKQFDAANVHLKAGLHLQDLPPRLGTEIDRISKMKYFEEQLEAFLIENGLPSIDATRVDGWIHFQHLYAKVVEDTPLVMTPENVTATVASVTVNVDLAKAPKHEGGDIWFRVRWIIRDKNGQSGELSIYNSFDANPIEKSL
jgi:hypothetical protein